MSLNEEIKGLIGKKRRFLLFRIAGIDTDVAKKLCKVSQGTYNTWTRLPNNRFVELYRRKDEFSTSYRHEAIRMLRRDNQLSAVLLEERIIQKLKEELDLGEYNLIRTSLARDVYSRLMGDLDAQPQTQVLSWEQRLNQLFIQPNQQESLPEGVSEVIEGEFTNVPENCETAACESSEPQKSCSC